MSSPATNQPWPVGWLCTLAATNRNGAKATGIDLRQRCSLLSCPACSRFDVRGRVQALIRATNEWRLCRQAPTIPLGSIDVALFGPADVEAVFRFADTLATRLHASGEVVGFLLKIEFAPGRKGTSNAVHVVLPHIHAELLTRSPIAHTDIERMAGGKLPGLHLQPCDDGWTRYLGKPVVSDGNNWNPGARQAVVDVLDKWQQAKQLRSRSTGKRGKRCHAYRFGGLAHGHGFRWAHGAMERRAQIEKLTGDAKQSAQKAAKRSASFRRWASLWALWRRKKYSGRFTRLDPTKQRVLARPALVETRKIGGARRAERAVARSPCLPAPFANCLRGALKGPPRLVLQSVTGAQTADCLLTGGQAGAARTNNTVCCIRGPPFAVASGRANVCTSCGWQEWAS